MNQPYCRLALLSYFLFLCSSCDKKFSDFLGTTLLIFKIGRRKWACAFLI